MTELWKWLRWRGIVFLAALTPPCRQIVQWASQRYETPLSPLTRLRMRVHLKICAACERYLRQLDFLHAAADRLGRQASEVPPATLAAEAKVRLRARLRCERVDPGGESPNELGRTT